MLTISGPPPIGPKIAPLLLDGGRLVKNCEFNGAREGGGLIELILDNGSLVCSELTSCGSVFFFLCLLAGVGAGLDVDSLLVDLDFLFPGLVDGDCLLLGVLLVVCSGAKLLDCFAAAALPLPLFGVSVDDFEGLAVFVDDAGVAAAAAARAFFFVVLLDFTFGSGFGFSLVSVDFFLEPAPLAPVLLVLAVVFGSLLLVDNCCTGIINGGTIGRVF